MKKIFGLLILLGFILVLGTAGASDCETIGFGQIVVQVLIGMAMVGVGYFGLQKVGA